MMVIEYREINYDHPSFRGFCPRDLGTTQVVDVNLHASTELSDAMRQAQRMMEQGYVVLIRDLYEEATIR